MTETLRYRFEITVYGEYPTDPLNNPFTKRVIDALNDEAHLHLDLPVSVRCQFIYDGSGAVLGDWGMRVPRRHPLTIPDVPPVM